MKYVRIPHRNCRRHAKPGQVSFQTVRAAPRLVDLKRAYRAARRMVDGERVSFEVWLNRFEADCLNSNTAPA